MSKEMNISQSEEHSSESSSDDIVVQRGRRCSAPEVNMGPPFQNQNRQKTSSISNVDFPRSLSFVSPPPTRLRERRESSRGEAVQHVLRNNALLSPFVVGTPFQPNLTTESAETTFLDDTAGPEDVYKWIQEVSYRQADGQALHTVIYLSAAAMLWALLYLNYLLLSVYFTPITWAVLCSMPLRRCQDYILTSIENETSVRLISLKILMGVCTWVALDLIDDNVTGTLCKVLLVWVASSRLVSALGWSLGLLSVLLTDIASC